MKKKHLREIERINKSIPKELLDKLIKKEIQAPVSKKIIEKALADTDPMVIKIMTPELKAKYQAILDSGELDKEIDVVDSEVEKQIDEYLEGEFEKARKLGRLPPPQKMPKLKTKSKKLYVNSANVSKQEKESNK